MIYRKIIFLLCFIFVIGTFYASFSLAITKQTTGNILRGELRKYFDQEPTILTVNDFTALLNFYAEMPSQGDVSPESSGLSNYLGNFLSLAANNGDVNSLSSDKTLNGRPLGAYCGDAGNYICGTRNCSNWGLCDRNVWLTSDSLKEFGDSCQKGYECKTGNCRGTCRAKPCTDNSQCMTGRCVGTFAWFNQPAKLYCYSGEDAEFKGY